jgi:hypothetical protein
MQIKEIHIRNFRSIRSITFGTENFNIFVGLNDVGKSNILKALNLFFNGQTDNGIQFNFDNDFSYHFPKTSHSTKEIKIVIRFEVPDTYKESGIITWEKSWRAGQYFTESMSKNGMALPPRSRVESALRRIRFRYVPAVKSKDYYKDLLVELYNTISVSLSSSLSQSTAVFSQALKENTEDLSKSAFDVIGINSVLTVPSDLKDIFKSLIFETQSHERGIAVSLGVRGDGIQARHIPVILNYIAEQDQKSRNKGSMRVFTIWGYEEPENGLEMAKCFEVADEFVNYSSKIQIFTTTHSPAFYMKKDKADTAAFFINKDSISEETKIIVAEHAKELDSAMGLMPLVAPYIVNYKNQVEAFKNIINNNGLMDINTIFVEGKTDEKYLRKAIEYLNPILHEKINDGEIRIIVKDGCGGVGQVKDWILAWCHTAYQSKALALFDWDKAASRINQELDSDERVQAKRQSKIIKLLGIKPCDSINSLRSKGILIEYSIEHLLPIDIWKRNRQKVRSREPKDYYSLRPDISDPAKSYNSIIEQQVPDSDIRKYFIYSIIPDNCKDKFCESVIKISETDNTIFAAFKPTIDEIASFFNL